MSGEVRILVSFNLFGCVSGFFFIHVKSICCRVFSGYFLQAVHFGSFALRCSTTFCDEAQTVENGGLLKSLHLLKEKRPLLEQPFFLNTF
jgi:hypothetical protein